MSGCLSLGTGHRTCFPVAQSLLSPRGPSRASAPSPALKGLGPYASGNHVTLGLTCAGWHTVEERDWVRGPLEAGR